ncbi:photosynthetic complex assembly protein PuhC, putative [Rhodomicrobium vannielii ATCC 17100]|uniref:Photosynthetic complex assembly protein PuhC, putative n=1 Tax=Rhodomicrobium vannielii (strain ATCC 17100 / DSM 162 / LMG 4299 / NCIMB 10020 / ATH 3.1.1) TaxID=648757 RepID=E3I2I0_RHOVT|nr:photosynthetic complex assembly protein PuhC [Rhodomicrobium vannielii]ADP70264.1 photosynthetic complex assembly protein PuhC, putative [Rhodomicrobium vannielii ATCC 17100]
MFKGVNKALLLGSVAVAALLVIVIGTSVIDRHGGGVADASRRPLVSRAVVFRDAPSGGIAAFDQGATEPFQVLEREKNTFMATSLRLLGQVRQTRSKAGPETPFVVTQWSDGKLTLTDPTTGETLELAAYGQRNADTFSQLLPQASVPR